MTAATQVQSAAPAGARREPRQRSLLQLAWWKFRRHRMAVFGVVLLVLLLGYCTVGSLALPYKSSIYNDLTIKLQGPSLAHPFGTDEIGRDVLARSIYGGQISLIIGIAAALVEVGLGVLVGTVSAYYGGWLDNILMRFTEGMLSIPSLFLLLIMAKYFSGKIPNIDIMGRTFTGSVIVIIVVIGLTSWMYTARIVRGNILSLREQEFITAAHCFGAQNIRIMTRHLLPNTMAPIIVAATLGVANAILQEAYVSFLGLGVQAPTATWGSMLDSSYKHLEDAPWLWFFPGMLIVLTVLAINFVGDGLRDALDPRTRTE
jgi:peptide/nickel transport system permease protein